MVLRDGEVGVGGWVGGRGDGVAAGTAGEVGVFVNDIDGGEACVA